MSEKTTKPFANVRSIVTQAAVLMLFFAVISCESSQEPYVPDEPTGYDTTEQEDCDNTGQFPALKGTTWKLVGIVDIETGILREFAPKHCVECYTLTFETDRIFRVRVIEGVFTMNLDYLSPWVTDDLWLEKYDGNFYWDSNYFRRAVAGAVSYCVTPEELRLFNLNYYLGEVASYSLFKRIEDCDNTGQFPALKGTTWKLVGIVDAKTGTLRELEPKHCVKCYTLTFETDRIFFVRSIEDVFKMDLDNPFGGIWGILWCEEYDGNHYCDSQDFRNTVASARSYSVTDEKLRLYVYSSPAEGLIWYSLFKRIDL